jgi:hypothetical protein
VAQASGEITARIRKSNCRKTSLEGTSPFMQVRGLAARTAPVYSFLFFARDHLLIFLILH